MASLGLARALQSAGKDFGALASDFLRFGLDQNRAAKISAALAEFDQFLRDKGVPDDQRESLIEEGALQFQKEAVAAGVVGETQSAEAAPVSDMIRRPTAAAAPTTNAVAERPALTGALELDRVAPGVTAEVTTAGRLEERLKPFQERIQTLETRLKSPEAQRLIRNLSQQGVSFETIQKSIEGARGRITGARAAAEKRFIATERIDIEREKEVGRGTRSRARTAIANLKLREGKEKSRLDRELRRLNVILDDANSKAGLDIRERELQRKLKSGTRRDLEAEAERLTRGLGRLQDLEFESDDIQTVEQQSGFLRSLGFDIGPEEKTSITNFGKAVKDSRRKMADRLLQIRKKLESLPVGAGDRTVSFTEKGVAPKKFKVQVSATDEQRFVSKAQEMFSGGQVKEGGIVTFKNGVKIRIDNGVAIRIE